MTTVYIASAYSLGDPVENVNAQIRAANELRKAGFNPFLPLLQHYEQVQFPREYQYWMDVSIDWMKKCDCVFRLPGESNGADVETLHANLMNMPVFYELENLVRYYNNGYHNP